MQWGKVREGVLCQGNEPPNLFFAFYVAAVSVTELPLPKLHVACWHGGLEPLAGIENDYVNHLSSLVIAPRPPPVAHIWWH